MYFKLNIEAGNDALKFRRLPINSDCEIKVIFFDFCFDVQHISL